MNQSKSSSEKRPAVTRQLGLFLLVLLGVLAFLFREGLLPGHTVFSNDGPLGAISARCARLPAGFFGYWNDLNWIGTTGPSATPGISQILGLVCGPLIFSKIYAPFALLFLGFSAWLCFRQWQFTSAACILGALATALNSDFFSTACWGVAAQPISFGCDFLALAALADNASPKRWARVILAGFAVGMGVMEAFDIGAIFSLVVAAYVVYQAFITESTTAKRITTSVLRLALVAGFAAFIASSAVSTLVGTQIKGVAGMGQDAESKARRWDEATQWSMPKGETLSLVVPGLFGFRMDTPDGGNYWGRGGRHGAWDRYFASGKKEPRPDSRAYFIRYGGGGVYAGVLVALVAAWTIAQSFRKSGSVFSDIHRKFIWFWTAVGLLALLVAFGRFAPFYQVFYALPFASTMRNPAKFMHVVEWVLVILFAYGVNALSQKSLDVPTAASRGLSAQLKSWWAKASAFDKNWVRGCAAVLVASVLGWFFYSSSRQALIDYLQEVDFDSATAATIASFSIAQVGFFLILLTIALLLLVLVLSGYFSGRRARTGAILLGLFLVVDLAKANTPWVVTWDWERKYASNPIIDLLREKPYEHRVAVLPFSPPPQFTLFSQLYDIEWKQQLFPYNNIQSLDVIMMPRAPVDYMAFESALFFDRTTNALHKVTRRWELTNTRYLLGAAGFLDPLNQQIDLGRNRFRIAARFDIAPKPGVQNPTSLDQLTAVPKPDGQYAVFDFTGALPRAKLYSNWLVVTNDEAALTNLVSADFNPARTVLVADQIPAPAANATNENAGTVEFKSYAPKDIVLEAKAHAASVLLLNDHYHPDWKVTVDGKPEPLLRCNYLMRGVYLQPGTHKVEFRFSPPIGTLYVSIAAVILGLALLGWLGLAGKKETPPPRTP